MRAYETRSVSRVLREMNAIRGSRDFVSVCRAELDMFVYDGRLRPIDLTGKAWEGIFGGLDGSGVSVGFGRNTLRLSLGPCRSVSDVLHSLERFFRSWAAHPETGACRFLFGSTAYGDLGLSEAGTSVSPVLARVASSDIAVDDPDGRFAPILAALAPAIAFHYFGKSASDGTLCHAEWMRLAGDPVCAFRQAGFAHVRVGSMAPGLFVEAIETVDDIVRLIRSRESGLLELPTEGDREKLYAELRPEAIRRARAMLDAFLIRKRREPMSLTG